MTSIPGAPVRSVRFCSTRFGESPVVCATSPVASPRPKMSRPVKTRIGGTLFIAASYWKKVFERRSMLAGRRHRQSSQDVDRLNSRGNHRVDRTTYLIPILGIGNNQLDAKIACRRLKLRTSRHRVWVRKHPHTPAARNEFVQDFQSLHIQFAREETHAGRVATGPRHAS